MKVKANTVIKNLRTLTFFVKETEIDIPEDDKEQLFQVDVNNISCGLEIQKLLEQHWVYGKPPEIKSRKKKNIFENFKKRLGLR